MKIRTLLIIAMLAAAGHAQSAPALATAAGRRFTAENLSDEARALWQKRDQLYAVAREQLLSQMAAESVLELEAKEKNTTPAELIRQVKTRIADPTDEQIKAIYDVNRVELGNKPFEEVRRPIIEFLRREPEQSALKTYVDELAARHKISYQKEINAAGLRPDDVLFSVGGRSFTSQDFESKYRLALYDARADVFDDVRADLESTILSTLVSIEASALKIEPQAFIAREVTDRMKQFSDDERAELENALKRRLFAKYKARILIEPPPPIVQKISTDDDPALGPANAPVIVVMFGDFQCSACAKTHPTLKKVMAEFPGKVRFVARDFPLDNIHENAFAAALAAGAAHAQGKFFEYGELLYANQDSLDPASLRKFAARLGLNEKQFEIDFTAEKTAAEVEKDVADGQSYGVAGTPTIFVNGVKVRRLSAEYFREAIENALAKSVARPARR